MLRRTLMKAGAALAAAPLAATASSRNDGMAQSLRVIVPWGPGDASDRFARFVADRLSEQGRAPVVVDNKPGADAILAVQALLAAPPDGRTLMVATATSMVLNPLLRRDLPYEPRDLKAVAMAYQVPSMFVAGAQSPFRNLKDLISAALQRPGQISVGHSSQTFRVQTLLMERETGVRFNHIPYKTNAQAMNDVAAGTLDMALTGMTLGTTVVESGRVRALAVASAQPVPQLPGVPTTAQLGLPELEHAIWVGLATHGRTPEPDVRRIEESLLKVFRLPAFENYLLTDSKTTPSVLSSAEFTRKVSVETERYRRLLASTS